MRTPIPLGQDRQEFGSRSPIATPRVNGMAAVAIAERHTSKNHEILGKIDELLESLVPQRPGLLRARAEAVLLRKKHHGLHVHTEICPLAGLHLAIDGENESDGSAEESEVLCKLPETRRLVFTWDAQGAIEIFAILESARPVRLCETVRIDLVFGTLPHRLSSRLLRDVGFEPTQMIARERPHVPGLEIPSRG